MSSRRIEKKATKTRRRGDRPLRAFVSSVRLFPNVRAQPREGCFTASVREIYLDNASTTRPAREVVAAMLPFLEGSFGNASSLHRRGALAARALEEARAVVAQALEREAGEIVFTSGGTEANNLALRGAALALRRRGDHVVSTAVEHPSVLEPLAALAKEGFRVSLAKPGRDGRLDPEAVVSLVEEKTVLLSVMHVQNETGAIFPVDEIAVRAKRKRADLVIHADGVQALGKLPPPSRAVDLYSVSAHKIHGPQGAGALAVAKGTRLLPLILGGGHESGLRSGTENLAALVGFGVAASLARQSLVSRRVRAVSLRDQLARGLREVGASVLSPEDGVATTILASFEGAPAEPLLHALEERGVLASSGSACSSKKSGHGKSHVLEAMGLPAEVRASALRFSLSSETTEEDVREALAALKEALGAVASVSRRRTT
ncbi:cysteine desulfurase [bacterium]|nr:cysteine desulfurase [bacterium]